MICIFCLTLMWRPTVTTNWFKCFRCGWEFKTWNQLKEERK